MSVWLLSCGGDDDAPVPSSAVVARAATGSDGTYRFACVRPGEYRVVARAPAGHVFSELPPRGGGGGGGGAPHSAIDPEDGRTACFELGEGERTVDWSFGLRRPGDGPGVPATTSGAPSTPPAAAIDGWVAEFHILRPDPTAGNPTTGTPTPRPAAPGPSSRPTLGPSFGPTGGPTLGPSSRPTKRPSSRPTPEPTSRPCYRLPSDVVYAASMLLPAGLDLREEYWDCGVAEDPASYGMSPAAAARVGSTVAGGSSDGSRPRKSSAGNQLLLSKGMRDDDDHYYDDEGDAGRGDEDGGAEEAAADDVRTMSPSWRPIQGNRLKPRRTKGTAARRTTTLPRRSATPALFPPSRVLGVRARRGRSRRREREARKDWYDDDTIPRRARQNSILLTRPTTTTCTSSRRPLPPPAPATMGLAIGPRGPLPRGGCSVIRYSQQ